MSHVERAELLAELGRYDEAAGELAEALASQPEDVEAMILMARVLRAADKPREAIDWADRAVAAAPDDLGALGVRGLVLVDLERYPEAATTAEQLLRLGPDNAYAQITGALVLANSRNGQPALNAAWHGVRLAPENPQAHLVLGIVCALLGQWELAEHAHREALRLDPQMAHAHTNLGMIRLEQRRYAEALEFLTRGGQTRPSDTNVAQAVGHGVRQVLALGAGFALIAAVVVGPLSAGGGAAGRVLAVVLAGTAVAIIAVFVNRMRTRGGDTVAKLIRSSGSLTLGVWAVGAIPVVLLAFAVLGSPWLLAALVACGAVALFSNLAGER